MRRIVFLGLLSKLLILAGYAQEGHVGSYTTPQVREGEIAIQERPFIYQSGNRRDPFKPLVSEREVSSKREKRESISEVDIVSLRLSGLIWDSRERLALLHDGGNFGYILKKGRLFGPNYKLIKGISGVIKPDGVYLTKGKEKVRLTLKGEEEE